MNSEAPTLARPSFHERRFGCLQYDPPLKSRHASFVERVKTILFGPVSRQAAFSELQHAIQLRIWGRRNERVTIRVLNPSGKFVEFSDGEYWTKELNDRIPRDREWLDVQFGKEFKDGYVFEITTRGGTNLVMYRAA